MRKSFMSQFNEAQMQAITHNKGPFMCLAGPGSGKTTVITQRTKYLIEECGVNPARILVITFTKAAAVEMQERFETLMQESSRVLFGTFHAIFFRILRQAYNYTVNNIIREDVKRQYIRELVEKEDMELSDETDVISEILGEISYVKGEMMDPAMYYSKNCSDEVFRRIFAGYVSRCQKAGLIDFDDMQGYCLKLLQSREDILHMWQQHFQYILIDEFQDINRIQYEIIKMLAKPENNLFIVGDDDQSIYHFRGAKPEIMLHFTDDYEQAKTVLLGVNYRSSKDIVESAKQVIANNKERYDKDIKAFQSNKEPVHVIRFDTQKQENEDIIRLIRKYNSEGMLYSNMAVIYRTSQQPRRLTEKLLEYNIPFRMKDGIFNLYDHWISKNILAYIRLGLGDQRRSNFLSIMNRPKRYIRRDFLDSPQVDWERLKMKVADKDWMVQRIEDFCGQVSLLKKMTPYAAVNFIRKGIGYDDYIAEYCKERQIQSDDFYSILSELQESAKDYRTYDEWFMHMERYREQLKEMQRQDDGRDAVLFATMHASKGLEFETVFILDACEGVTPHKKAVKPSEIEEERRMFYVAMTRAKTHLHIYVVKQMLNKTVKESRFIGELEFDRRNLSVGNMVEHKKFGKGTVTFVDAERVSIYFEALQDTKTFRIEYAVTNGYIRCL